MGAHAETALLVACLPVQASTFERLQAAGKLARSLIECEPQSLLLWQQGCDPAAAAAALLAAVAALEAAAFRLATFKSKPKPRRRLARIDIAATGKLRDLDRDARVRRRQQYRPLAHRFAAERVGRSRLPAPDQRISRARLA